MQLGSRAMAGVLSLAPALLILACRSEPPLHPNIFLFTVESLRPDHLGMYSGKRNTTPNLDAFAEESMVYENAHSVTSWTLASHASIFTGLYPTAHGATGPRSKLDESALTLADLLAEKGYQTAGVASGPYLAKRHNLNQGFEYYDDTTATVGTQGGAHDDVTNPFFEKVILRFLAHFLDPKRPLFFFAYYWDPHYDYIPPAPFDTMFVEPGSKPIEMRGYESRGTITKNIDPARFSYLLSQYDGEIGYTDHYLGLLFEHLKRAGLYEESVIIVTSDHGEEFFDHGNKGHKRNLYVESVHVPLMVKYPRSTRKGRDTRIVSLVDLFPTILDLARTVSPLPHQGTSLLEPDPDPNRSIFFELLSTFYHRLSDGSGFSREDHEFQAILRAGNKLILVKPEERAELYRVSSDPGEQIDIAAQEPSLVAKLRSELSSWREDTRRLGSSAAGGEAALEPDQIERLRALGYLDRSEESAEGGAKASAPETVSGKEP